MIGLDVEGSVVPVDGLGDVILWDLGRVLFEEGGEGVSNSVTAMARPHNIITGMVSECYHLDC